ncbi:MAG: hypothetical protein J2P46_21670 [Zavarzinella sp.]|nr:hypothetical protein [Zavarzinella sp.]
MAVFALTELWNDFTAVGGLVVGVAGLLVGVLGFAYTIRQVWKTQSAAEAARQAADRAAGEAARTFRRFLVGQAHVVFSELCLLVQDQHWDLGAVRSEDLAGLLAQLADDPATVAGLVDLLRDSALAMRRKERLASARFPQRQWQRTTRQVRDYLDRAIAPYGREGGFP